MVTDTITTRKSESLLRIVRTFSCLGIYTLRTRFVLGTKNIFLFRRKKESREPHIRAEYVRKLHGLKAKLYNRKRFAEKIEMRKKIRTHELKESKNKKEDVVPKGAVPPYLLDR